jgi:hypothetical protein
MVPAWREEEEVMGLLPSFSNLVHKYAVEVALFNQLKAGFKEANRQRIPAVVTTSNSPSAVKVFVAPWAGSVESLIVAGATGTTSGSTNGNSVTFTVTDLTTGVILFTGDTYVNATELVANTGVGFFNSAPAMSNGARA